MQGNRTTTTRRALCDLRRQGEAGFVADVPEVPFWMCWVWLPKKKGQGQEKRFVVSTVQ